MWRQNRKFTESEITKSKTAPSSFSQVKPSDIFGKGANCQLAELIARTNPIRFHELQQEWRYEIGLDRRPAADLLKQYSE
jgi:hypothetical protein